MLFVLQVSRVCRVGGVCRVDRVCRGCRVRRVRRVGRGCYVGRVWRVGRVRRSCHGSVRCRGDVPYVRGSRLPRVARKGTLFIRLARVAQQLPDVSNAIQSR